MRNPVRSEADAFHIVVGGGAVLVAAVVVGALVSPWVGLALVAGAAAGALVWEIATRDPQRRQPLKEAMELGRSHGAAADGRRRVLVVANRTLQSDALRDEIAERAGRRRRRAADRADPVLARALPRDPTSTASSARRASAWTTCSPGPPSTTCA